MGKYLKVKGKHGKVKEGFDSERRKLSEEVENIWEGCRKLGVEKKHLEIELKDCQSLLVELNQRIEVLERQKKEEIKLILTEKTVVEAEKRTLEAESKKKVLELDQRIEVLEREWDTEVCRAKRERSEEIKKILNEKKVLEVEKQELEVETREKDERIKVLVQEKECLEGKGKEIETNWSAVKLHEDMVLPQRVHPARNVDILSTPTAQNQGSQSVDASHNEPDHSISLCSLVAGEVAKPETNICGQKRKAPTPEADHEGNNLSWNKKLKEWNCKLCNVISRSEMDFHTHTQGRKHKAKVTKETSCGTTDVLKKCNSNEKPFTDVVMTSDPEANTNIITYPRSENKASNNNGDTPEKAMPSAKSSEKSNFWCEMCKLGATSANDMAAHEAGKKHLRKLHK